MYVCIHVYIIIYIYIYVPHIVTVIAEICSIMMGFAQWVHMCHNDQLKL